MKKHKFSDKLPEVGREIVAEVEGSLGTFRVRKDYLRDWFIDATFCFISGHSFDTDVFNTEQVLEYKDNWWADPEEES